MGLGPLPPLVALLICACVLADSPPGETVCGSVDIRNRASNLRRLENCTVIEGSLAIQLIDNGRPEDYDHLSFPKLKEITDYLLLYRVFGLNSVGKLFPNLSVIRGNSPFHNYALVIFELYQLQEIGLTKLTDVLHGSVRIERNPQLCYVDTIDWNLIAPEGGHFIKANKQINCPQSCLKNNSDELCSFSTKKKHHLCWTSNSCQKVCTDIGCDPGVSCDERESTCCFSECLGGCNGPYSSNCTSCKHVTYNGRCMKKCPFNTYEYKSWRCIQEDECRRYGYKPFEGKCLSTCPAGYIEHEKDRFRCKKCTKECPKVCLGGTVEHVSSIRSYKGCTRINGSLSIHITQGGSNIIKELEENMGMIEQIDGFLKVARSFPIVSLNFLKSLKIIGNLDAHKKERKKNQQNKIYANYSFLVLDNPNLQDLWDWDNRKTNLSILNGKIFFHFNPKLCPQKIWDLKKYAKMQDWDERDVSPNSNGDRAACDVTNMNVSVRNISPTVVDVRWESFLKHIRDERSLLGYVIYYREAPYQNISIFEGRDACGTDVWAMHDVESPADSLDFVNHSINSLKPFTQYALYIRTYTTSSERQGAQSSVVYFKTEPDTPSPPMSVKASSPVPGEVVVTWKPPKKPNGNITHYIVQGVYEDDPIYFTYTRDYCQEPIFFPDYKSIYDEDSRQIFDNATSSSIDSSEEDAAGKCICRKDHRPFGMEDDAEFQIHFEDFLHNKVYVKKPVITRNRRTAVSTTESTIIADTSLASIDKDLYLNGTLLQFKKIVQHNPFVVVPNLRHFTEYKIEVRACQDKIPEMKADPCSTKAITSVRTLHQPGADDVVSSTIHVQTENMTSYSVFVRWEEPKDSNGIIVAYTLEYRRVGGENYIPKRACVTRSHYVTGSGYILTELSPGNYSLKVRATSLAAHGNWTKLVFFTIHAVNANSILEKALAISVVVFLLLTFGGMYGVYRWKLNSRIPDYVDYASVNPEYMSSNLVYVADEWEIDRDKVKLLDELGQGSFGMVYRGEVSDLNGFPIVPCAAKTVNESATLRERIEFLQEASVMKAFKCHHVIKLLGVVSKGQPTLVIMELMTNGDLKSYLRSHRPDDEEFPDQQPPTLKQILQMATEIADGMAYLAAKKFVHRDLAARNCMVAEDLTVKIGDFGMTRDVYETDYYRKGGKGLLPVRWMSPESLKDGVFDSQSDVWSYGVVLWEMATLASQPYQGLSNEDVLKYVIAGNTMEKPENCPEKLFSLMSMCWHKNSKARPTFVELIEMLLPDVNQNFHNVSYYFNLRQLPNTFDCDDAVSPNTPLRSSAATEEEQQPYRYFPSATQLPEDNVNGDGPGGVSLVAINGPSSGELVSVVTNCDEGSKSTSIQNSDSSKGSKISNFSNGSIANGHAMLPLKKCM